MFYPTLRIIVVLNTTICWIVESLLAAVGAVPAMAREKLVLLPLAVAATVYAVQFPVLTEARYLLPRAPLYALFLAQGLVTMGPPIKRWLDQAADQEREREEAKDG